MLLNCGMWGFVMAQILYVHMMGQINNLFYMLLARLKTLNTLDKH